MSRKKKNYKPYSIRTSKDIKQFRRSDGIVMKGFSKKDVKLQTKKNKFTPNIKLKYKKIK